MESEWPIEKLGDCVDSCLGKMLDQNKNTGVLFPYLGNSNVRWGRFELDGLAQMKFEDHEHERYGLKKGDLVICEGGEPGRCAIWNDETPNMRIQKALHRVRPKERLDSVFLYYWFLHNGRLGFLEPYFTGTTIKHLTGRALKEIPIKIPSIKYQKKIANLLRSFDRKIELNYQINQTLEQMAQALFKSWFVDFDPVIDNALDAGNPIPDALAERAARRQTARASDDFQPLPDDVRQLFPNEFEESELGWIPKGWTFGVIEDIANINPTSWTNKTAPRTVDYVDLASAKDGMINNIDFYFYEDAPSRAKRIINMHDTIFGLVRPANKSFAYVDRSGLTGSTGFAVIRAKIDFFKNYIYLAVTTKDAIDEFSRIADGGAYPAIKPEDIALMPVVIATDDVLIEFDKIVSSFREKMNLAAISNEKLSKLRDTLLPKLISGELRLDSPEVKKATSLLDSE